MKSAFGMLAALLLCLASAPAAPGPRTAKHVAAAEQAFLDYLDASGAVGFLESGKVDRFEGQSYRQFPQ